MFKERKEMERLLKVRRDAKYASAQILEHLASEILKKEQELDTLRREERRLLIMHHNL